jgi:hypothetical protein
MPHDPTAPRTTPAPEPAVQVLLDPRVNLRYHALALVPLPGDDADLYRPDYAAVWNRSLHQAGLDPRELARLAAAAAPPLAHGPARLQSQVDVLARPAAPFPDGPLGALERFLAPTHAAAWNDAADAAEACRAWFAGDLAVRAPLLRPLRLAGLARLAVFLCPALAGSGRATRAGERYLVAVGLPEDDTARRAALLQLLHECCHPLADELMDRGGASPDTARAAAGHPAQRRREDAALVLGYHWLAGYPQLRASYLQWVARYRDPARLELRLAEALDLPADRRPPVLDRAAAVARLAAP